MYGDVTAQLLFDGTFSSDSVASAAHALVARLHDEAMATIAELAEHWDSPLPELPVEDEPVVYREPATWSIVDDEDDALASAEDEDVRVVPQLDLPALLPRPRTTPSGLAGLLATATTDEFAVPVAV